MQSSVKTVQDYLKELPAERRQAAISVTPKLISAYLGY